MPVEDEEEEKREEGEEGEDVEEEETVASETGEEVALAVSSSSFMPDEASTVEASSIWVEGSTGAVEEEEEEDDEMVDEEGEGEKAVGEGVGLTGICVEEGVADEEM